MGAAIAAIIIKKEKDLVSHFQQARAVSVATARTLGSLQVDDERTLRRLQQRAVIREGAPGTFYLDEPSWLALQFVRRRMVGVAVLLALMVIIATVLLVRGRVAP